MYDEKEHAHEGHKMSILAKVAWVLVGIYASLILMSAMFPPASVTQERKTYQGPLTREDYEGRLLCDKPVSSSPPSP